MVDGGISVDRWDGRVGGGLVIRLGLAGARVKRTRLGKNILPAALAGFLVNIHAGSIELLVVNSIGFESCAGEKSPITASQIGMTV